MRHKMTSMSNKMEGMTYGKRLEVCGDGSGGGAGSSGGGNSWADGGGVCAHHRAGWAIQHGASWLSVGGGQVGGP